MSSSNDGASAPEAPTDGFPDGTIIVTGPATCPDPGTYVTPPCAHETQLIHIPMDTSTLVDTDALPPTGNEPGSAILTAALLFSAGIAAVRSSTKKRRAAKS